MSAGRPFRLVENEQEKLCQQISYDSEVDALTIRFCETTVTTDQLGDGIAADYDANGKLTGIEILDAIKRFGDKETLGQVVIEGLGPTQSN
jgi:YD repeat-containing protein